MSTELVRLLLPTETISGVTLPKYRDEFARVSRTGLLTEHYHASLGASDTTVMVYVTKEEANKLLKSHKDISIVPSQSTSTSLTKTQKAPLGAK